MRAVLFDAFGGPLRCETLPDPSPSSAGVVIRVHATGLCRSDWHGWQGHDPDIREFPHVPGHELAGEVAAVGSDVANWRVGDRVTVPFVCACGSCVPCKRGDGQVCDAQTQPGFTHWGSYADYVAIHHADVNLVALPETMPYTTAASLGCRFATAFRAVVDQGRVRAGEWVAVFGCGGVGLSSVMIARALGARVIAVDVSAAALALASTAGAELVLNAREHDDVAELIRTQTDGGVDSAYDALGSAVTARQALCSLRKNGRHVQIGLLAGDDAEPRLPLHLLIGRELELIGSHGMAAHAYPRMLDMVSSGRLDPGQLITRHITLDEAPLALSTMVSAPRAGVTIIAPS
jgi:D-arabinose 1-dehydrogenase-like Zn-dependent alcohol dehydrogenase